MLTRIDAGFRSVRDFTANASHELRTPLARLRTEVEIALLRPRQAAEYRESLEHLHQATIDMSGLIDSLLTIARAEAGTEVLRMSLVDLSSLFRSITDEWSPIASRLSIRFQIAGLHPHDGPLTVLGDRLSILRLLRVLLDNAFKFTPSGGAVTITVTPGEDIILLAVDDTGIGIAHEHHKAVFDRFFRVYGDTGKHRTGAGLGLSLAQWIAEQHGTTISLTSTPEQGSRFQISLTRIVPDEFTAMPVSHDQVKSLEPVKRTGTSVIC